MIYIGNMTTPQTVYVPLALDGGQDMSAASFGLLSTVDLAPVELGGVEVRPAGSARGWLAVTLTLPEGLADGSYEYRITAEGQTVSSGCAQVGAYGAEIKQYEKDITYMQYERED